ncbi:hypothetical protein TcasGA2_TC010957 [Tribolium castaneum]|uniref:Lipoprotein n=1 Tax=Tribolium castaneum TaxID=7070 RepID=D6WN93_TRICA|nr:PREDICTED: uncharacterized protein LOC103314635 [Tribolium castaneum]EFA03082.2 hypothetical protein TcasGA2_TC010957 [Tribolium castaneum]|eukprot:XP_015835455.1 PREDICTED: uncharacterized protein LOC103314635 [Tribolium castaneum]
MLLFFLLFGASLPFFHCVEKTPNQLTSEDLRVLNETIEKFGPPQDYKQLGLPGPEIETAKIKLLHKNKLESDEAKNYTLRIRTIAPRFSYNGRYEESVIHKINGGFEEFPVIKGQFGEHFPSNTTSDVFYIRTIGYTLDEKGYRQFLLDLTAVKIIQKLAPSLIIEGIPISSTVLITLTGGNTLG